MKLHLVDWLVIGGYLGLALAIGIVLSRRASRSVDQFFLTGRSLPWWIAGTSMVATSFAADTPLVVTAWVRDTGIWMNWMWWCYALSGMLGTFLFARWWRRGEVMTKAELAELRYGGRGAGALRGTLGILHSSVTNVMVLCWVMLAAVKIFEVLFDIDKVYGVGLAALLAASYSALSGIWGVVITDLIQFAMALVGAFALAWLSWAAIGGNSGLEEAIATGGSITADKLQMMPSGGEGGFFDASFWTANVAAFAVWMGVAWWAVESADGASVGVQRIASTKNERHGLLASLWFNLLHYAVRPWPWIIVAIASLIVLPQLEVKAPMDGVVVAVSADTVEIESDDGAEVSVSLATEDSTEDWSAEPTVEAGESVTTNTVIGKSDSEKAYVVMMTRYLPIGLLGLMIASLLAAFMSTIDTHVNLSSAFFVNDVYRRFLRKNATDKHYIRVARIASFGVIGLAGSLTFAMDSIGDLFIFFLAFLSGVGPVYILRWLWWRIRAATEITAMITSGSFALLVTFVDIQWSLGSLSPDGELSSGGRLVVVVLSSFACAMLVTFLLPKPDPKTLVDFYRKVRPRGFWGPVRVHLTEPVALDPLAPIAAGVLGGLALIFGVLFATGKLLLDASESWVWLLIAAGGAMAVAWSLKTSASKDTTP